MIFSMILRFIASAIVTVGVFFLLVRLLGRYANKSFSCAILQLDDKEARLTTESRMLSTIAKCSECGAPQHWLGNHHPNLIIRKSGLWNTQGLNGVLYTLEEVAALLAGLK